MTTGRINQVCTALSIATQLTLAPCPVVSTHTALLVSLARQAPFFMNDCHMRPTALSAHQCVETPTTNLIAESRCCSAHFQVCLFLCAAHARARNGHNLHSACCETLLWQRQGKAPRHMKHQVGVQATLHHCKSFQKCQYDAHLHTLWRQG